MTYTVTMMEVQPQLTRLLAETDVTPVRLGRAQKPVVALVPWLHYLRWREALQLAQTVQLAEEAWSISKVSPLFLSYRHRLAPLFAPDPHTVHAVVVNVWDRPIGAVLSWQDWMRFALSGPSEPLETIAHPDEAEHKQSFTIVAARQHLLQLPGQFAQEEAQGRLEPLIVTKQNRRTKQHDPVFAIVPWALYQQWQDQLAQTEAGEVARPSPASDIPLLSFADAALVEEELVERKAPAVGGSRRSRTEQDDGCFSGSSFPGGGRAALKKTPSYHKGDMPRDESEAE